MKAGAEFKHQDIRGNTSLALVIDCKHEIVVRVLLDSRANLDPADEDGETPLKKARDQKMDGIVALFNDTLRPGLSP